jgi:hypothetical protein
VIADSATTGGTFTVNRSTFATGGDGAPPHFHSGAPGEADPAEIAASQERFDNHSVESPLWRATRG